MWRVEVLIVRATYTPGHCSLFVDNFRTSYLAQLTVPLHILTTALVFLHYLFVEIHFPNLVQAIFYIYTLVIYTRKWLFTWTFLLFLFYSIVSLSVLHSNKSIDSARSATTHDPQIYFMQTIHFVLFLYNPENGEIVKTSPSIY